MPLQTKLALIESDPTGTIIKIRESTGLYSSDNLTGYGGPNISASSVQKIVFTISRYDSDVVHTAIYVRVFDPLKPHEFTNPSIDQITGGEPILLNSILLDISEPEQGLVPFRDSVYDINEYSIVEAVTGVVGNAGEPFIIGSGFTDIINNNDAILIGDTIYDIDKSKPSNGGTVLYLTEELEEDTTTFEPAYRANLKVLVDSQSQYGIRSLSAKLYRGECDGCVDVFKERAYDTIVHTVGATSAMGCGSYEEANWNINESYRLVKSKCNCR